MSKMKSKARPFAKCSGCKKRFRPEELVKLGMCFRCKQEDDQPKYNFMNFGW